MACLILFKMFQQKAECSGRRVPWTRGRDPSSSSDMAYASLILGSGHGSLWSSCWLQLESSFEGRRPCFITCRAGIQCSTVASLWSQVDVGVSTCPGNYFPFPSLFLSPLLPTCKVGTMIPVSHGHLKI